MLRWILYALCTLFYFIPITKAENSIELLSAFMVAEHYMQPDSSTTCDYKMNSWLALSPDNRYLATHSYSNDALKLWNIENIDAIQEVYSLSNNEQRLGSIEFSPDGNYLLATQEKSIILRDVQTGTEVKRFEGHTETVKNATFSADGRFIVSGQECTIDDSSHLCMESTALLKVWDVTTSQENLSINVPASGINSVEFSPDGRFIVSGHDCENRINLEYSASLGEIWKECVPESPTLIAWDAKTGEKIRTFDSYGNYISAIGFSPDQQFLVSKSAGEALTLWNFATGEKRWNFEVQPYLPYFSSFSFSPDGHFFLYDIREDLFVWDIAANQHVVFNKINFEHFVADKTEFRSFETRFSADGKRLYTVDTDCMIKVWSFNFPEIPENNHEPPHPPNIYALTNQANYTAGDTFQFRFRTQNTSSKHYDAYVALLFPDNHFLTFESWLILSRQQITAIFNQVMPYFTDKALDIAYQYPILELQLPPETPKGHYQGCAVLTEAGSNILQGEHWVSSHCTGFMVQ